MSLNLESQIWKKNKSIFISVEFKQVVIDLQLLRSVNKSHNWFYVHQAWCYAPLT